MSLEDLQTLSNKKGPWAYILAEELDGYRLDGNRILDTENPKRQPLYTNDKGTSLELSLEDEFENSVAEYQAKFIEVAVARETAGTDSTRIDAHPVDGFPYWVDGNLKIYEVNSNAFWDENEGVTDYQEAVEAANSIANIVEDISLLREKQEEAIAEWIKEI